MSTIDPNQVIPIILKAMPTFQASWNAHLDYWDNEQTSLCIDISAFGEFVIERIQAGKNQEIGTLFLLIERFMVEGDDEVQNATATCLIESLLNRASTGDLSSRQFVPYLGAESRKYAKAWDDFTGVKTDGL